MSYQDKLQSQKAYIRKRIANIDRKIANIITAIEDGFIDFTELKDRMKQLKNEKIELEVKLKVLENKNSEYIKLNIDPKELKTLLIDMYKRNQGKGARKELSRLIDRIEYDNREFKVFYNKNLFKVLNGSFLVEAGGIEPPSENGRCTGLLQA